MRFFSPFRKFEKKKKKKFPKNTRKKKKFIGILGLRKKKFVSTAFFTAFFPLFRKKYLENPKWCVVR